MSRSESHTQAFLSGGGEMGALIRGFDWSSTSLGPPETWPQSLRTTVSILLNAHVPMFLWWGDDLIQFYNDAYRPSLGNDGKHPTAVGQRGADCWPESWATIGPLIEQVRAGGPATRSENRLVSLYRNGQVEDVYWTFGYSAVLDESGRVGGVLVVCQEITEKTRAFQQIEASQQLFKSLFTHTAVAMAVFRGSDFIIEAANPGVCALWGRTEAQVLGKPVFEALPEIADQGFEELLTNVLQTGQPFTGKEVPATIFRYGRLDTIYFDFVYEPLPEADGRVERILVTATDATERRQSRRLLEQSRQQLQTLFEQAPVGISIMRGPAHTFDMINDTYVRFVGRRHADEILGKPLLEALPEIEGQGFYELLTQVVQTGEPLVFNETPAQVIRNGQLATAYFNFTYQPLPAPDSGVFTIVVEVTESVLARRVVEENENRLNLAIDTAELGTWEYDPRANVITCTERTVELFGFAPGETVTLERALNAIVETDRPRIAEAVAYALQPESGGSYDVEYSLVNYTDGQCRTIQARGKAFFDEHGTATRFIGTALDITKAKQVEADLRESIGWFRQLADSMPQIVWTARADGFLDYFNQRWYQFIGNDMGFGDAGWLPILHPDDRQPCLEHWHACVRTGEPYQFEFRLDDVRHPGNYRWYLARATAFRDDQGTIRKWFGTCTDIDDQKRAEATLRESEDRFRAVADTAPVMIWISDTNKLCTFFSKGWLEFAGRTMEEEIGNGWAHGVHPDDLERCLEAYTTNFDARQEYFIEYRMRRYDGEYRWVSDHGVPRYLEDGTFLGYIGGCTDIHESRLAKEELERLVAARTQELLDLNADLERSNLDLMQFAYVASHDLKEPLRKIQMFGGLLERELKESLSERARQHLDVMTNSSARMQLLVEDVLNLSRLSQLDATYERVDLNAVVAAIVSDLHLMIQEKGARIEVGTLPRIEAVPGQMHQLFQNLISNGLKFNESPSPVVTIESVGNPAGTHIVIEVRDNGIGFAEEFKEKMFGMFQRLNGRVYAGTGIGLTICRKIVENHRGTIQAESQPGEGATFRVTLPVRSGAEV